MTRLSPRALGLIAALLTLVLDQGSKVILLYGAHFKDMPGVRMPVLPFFDLVMTWNPGISYGLFPVSGLGTALLIGVVAAIIAFLGLWLWRTDSAIVAIGCGLVIGGGIGNNLIDRLIYGKVADFFYFHAFGFDWYVFNIADVAVVLGAFAFIYDVLMAPESSKNA